MSDNHPIRVTIQQPTLAKYRVPVFQELASRDGIELTLLYGDRGNLPNVVAEGFTAEKVRFRQRRVGGVPIYWHGAQLRAASASMSDVAILSWDVHYASLVPALLRARRQNVPTIMWGHGYSKRERKIKQRIRSHIAGLASAALLYNQTARDQLLQQGWDPQHVFVALNSLDQTPIEQARAHWSARPDELSRFQDEQQLCPGPVLLYVSRFEPKNRVDLLLDAAATLRASHPDLQVVIIGKGMLLDSLKQHSHNVGVHECTRFLGAIYDETELATWFLSADLFVYPANIGLSLLHAFGYGLPAITSDNMQGQNPEIEALQPGVNGLVYEDGNAAAMAAAIESLLADRSQLEAMSAAAAATVRDRFNLKTMVDGMEQAIRYCASAMS